MSTDAGREGEVVAALDRAQSMVEFRRTFGRWPVQVDGGAKVIEALVVIAQEYLAHCDRTPGHAADCRYRVGGLCTCNLPVSSSSVGAAPVRV